MKVLADVCDFGLKMPQRSFSDKVFMFISVEPLKYIVFVNHLSSVLKDVHSVNAEPRDLNNTVCLISIVVD